MKKSLSLLCLLLCFVLTVAAIPAVTVAAEEETTPIWFFGEQSTAEDLAFWGASFDPESSCLTFEDTTVFGPLEGNNEIFVDLPEVTVIFKGDTTFFACGLVFAGDVTLVNQGEDTALCSLTAAGTVTFPASGMISIDGGITARELVLTGSNLTVASLNESGSTISVDTLTIAAGSTLIALHPTAAAISANNVSIDESLVSIYSTDGNNCYLVEKDGDLQAPWVTIVAEPETATVAFYMDKEDEEPFYSYDAVVGSPLLFPDDVEGVIAWTDYFDECAIDPNGIVGGYLSAYAVRERYQGDVNKDGAVNIKDVTYLLMLIANGVRVIDPEFDPTRKIKDRSPE